MTGRHYDLFEQYRMEDAEYVVVCINSTAGTVKTVVDDLREKGIKAGLLKIRVFRPFPGEQIAKALANAKAVAVLDKVPLLNHTGGPLFEDITSSMFVQRIQVPTINYSYGVGGRDVTEQNIARVFADLQALQPDDIYPYRFLDLKVKGE